MRHRITLLSFVPALALSLCSSRTAGAQELSPTVEAPENDDIEDFEAVAEVEAPPREATRRSVEGKALTSVPGTRGDAIRVIEVMPGVARTGGFAQPIIRGASWNESQVYLAGVPVPFLYHFGGLTSFYNSSLVERVDLYPGNFSARYGRVAGGVVEVTPRDPRTDRFHGALELSFVDSSVMAEAPITKDAAVAAAVRRSNIDFFFENFVPEDAFSTVSAPIYYDYQLTGVYQVTRDQKLRLRSYGSRDHTELLFEEPNAQDPGLAGRVGGAIEFHHVGLELEGSLSPTVTQELSATLGYMALDQHFGPLSQTFDGLVSYGRGEWAFDLGSELRATVGAEYLGWFLTGGYHGPKPGQLEGDPSGGDPIAGRELVADTADFDVVRPAAYVELAYRPAPRVLLLPGVRFDYFHDLDHHVSVDPRLSARVGVTESTTLKSGVGLYTQAPEFWQALSSVGNPKIDPYRALHTSAGVEQRVGDDVKLGVEGFYKRLYDTLVATPGNRPPHYLNDGAGRIFGGEVSAEARWDDSFGYLAYTLSRSERRDGNRPYRIFDQDQTHILSLVASQDLGHGFTVGARFRLVTGTPTTQVVGSTYDARSGVYRPVRGPTNAERNPAFHQLDVRAEKRWTFGDVELTAYLDVQNAYNAENPEGFRYSYDYAEKESVKGLPILPSLGVRGEL